jgi:hypothetical protein
MDFIIHLFQKRREFRIILFFDLLSFFGLLFTTKFIFSLNFIFSFLYLLLFFKWFGFLFTFFLHLFYLYQVLNVGDQSIWSKKLEYHFLLDQIEKWKAFFFGLLNICYPLYLCFQLKNLQNEQNRMNFMWTLEFYILLNQVWYILQISILSSIILFIKEILY